MSGETENNHKKISVIGLWVEI